MVFATIGFSLKTGLAIGSAALLWILAGFFSYDTQQPAAPNAIEGYRFMSSIFVGLLFAACTACMLGNKLNRQTTLQMAEELTQRRRRLPGPPPDLTSTPLLFHVFPQLGH